VVGFTQGWLAPGPPGVGDPQGVESQGAQHLTRDLVEESGELRLLLRRVLPGGHFVSVHIAVGVSVLVLLPVPVASPRDRFQRLGLPQAAISSPSCGSLLLLCLLLLLLGLPDAPGEAVMGPIPPSSLLGRRLLLPVTFGILH